MLRDSLHSPEVASAAWRIGLVNASTGASQAAAPAAWAPTTACLAAMLDELDYGVALVGADSQLWLLNRAARRDTAANGVLMLQGGVLSARDESSQQQLANAIAAAALRGLRGIVNVSAGDAARQVSVLPLGKEADARGCGASGAAMLVLSRRQLCEPLSIDAFARQHGLTHAEGQVLQALAQGESPQSIAQRHGVALSTVRTQIQSVFNKTGTRSVQHLVARLATLPPLVHALRVL